MTQTFSADLSKFFDKVEKKADAFLKTVAQEIALRIITRNPVKTGFSRASWWASLGNLSGHPGQPQWEAYKGKTGGAGSISTPFAAMTLTIGQARMGDVIYLANNAKYIQALERGHSNQAPAGMVAITLSEAQQIAEEVLAKIV